MALSSSPSKGPSSSPSKAAEQKLIVNQPKAVEGILNVIGSIEALQQRVSERSSEDAAGDWSGAGATTGGKAQTGTSARDRAIAAMPAPELVQQQLKQHIEKEITTLHKKAKRAAKSNKAGGAFELNEIYSNIRRLQALLKDILQASYDTLKRLFVRVFIDKQSIL